MSRLDDIFKLLAFSLSHPYRGVYSHLSLPWTCVLFDLQFSHRVDFLRPCTPSETCISLFRLVLLGRGFASHSATCQMIHTCRLQSRLGDIFKLFTFAPIVVCIRTFDCLAHTHPSYFADRRIRTMRLSFSLLAEYHVAR
jgi:hypothetical protein